MNKFVRSILLLVLLSSQTLVFARKIELGIDTYWGVTEFETLKNNYPSNRLEHNVAHYSKMYPDRKQDMYYAHCAINLSEALLASGFILEYKEEGNCNPNFDCETNYTGRHVLMASSLATILKEKYKDKVVELRGSDYLHYVKGKRGIIYFEDYWSRNETEWETFKPTGDHIDLWDENKLVSYNWGGTFVRNYLTNHRIENRGKGPSPLRQASKVYFFEMD